LKELIRNVQRAIRLKERAGELDKRLTQRAEQFRQGERRLAAGYESPWWATFNQA
jgi:hypothetical protein